MTDQKTMERRCPVCGGPGNTKPYRLKKYFYTCDPCSRKWEREKRKGKKEYARKRRKERNPKLLASDIRAAAIQRIKYPEKIKARGLVAKAIKSGEIIKPTICGSCGVGGRIEGHHYLGYAHPLIVQWLCVPCHRSHHKRSRGEA